MSPLAALLATIAMATAPAAEPADATGPALQTSSPYVTINLGVELHALERAARDAAQATEELAAAVGKMSTSPSLSDEHKAQLMAVIGRVDTLSARVVTAVDKLPGAVEATKEPLTEIADDLASRVRWTVIIVLGAALLVLIGALWGVYALFLRPTRRMLAETLGRFQNLAEALEHTATLVGESTAAQVALAERLERSTAAPAPQREDPETAGADCEPTPNTESGDALPPASEQEA